MGAKKRLGALIGGVALAVSALGVALPATAQADSGTYYLFDANLTPGSYPYAWYRDLPPQWHDNLYQFANNTDVSMCVGYYDRGVLYNTGRATPGAVIVPGRPNEADAIVDCRYFLA